MFVYLISNTRSIKIGFSSNVEKRLVSVNIGSDTRCKIFRKYLIQDGTHQEKEKYLHKVFNRKRLNGEWFELNKSDIKSIDNYFSGKSECIVSYEERNPVNAKWKIKGIENYYFGEDKKLYKLGFLDKAQRWNETKEVKKQYPNRYRINGSWWSERQLRNKLQMVTEEIELIKELPETPF